MDIPKFMYDNELCEIVVARYQQYRGVAILVQVVETGERMNALSVNLPELGHKLKDNQFFAQVDRQNERIAQILRDLKIFDMTNQHVHYGFRGQCRAEIWGLKSSDNPTKEGVNETSADRHDKSCITGDCSG